ncbi:hypothetical protein [Pontibacter amylolyticus]|uniref:Uncharacterized protein n=1 Tax=Pontibacter amylolyticus TaxID=1424080 RepID=A0ABQ1WAE9_9BACT|nr:hypothetical protein [Pontibacter amylolyticus]GGG19302.1 hypothetical protein GCM10011323_24280 [Pontibacter amylolyticus]
MVKYNLTWQESDAGLLDALLLATGGEGGATLQDVLLMGDAVDGTVFSLEEVTAGLEKLTAAGCIAIQKNKLYLSPEFLEAYEKATLDEGVEEKTARPLEKLLHQKGITAEAIEQVRTSVFKKYKVKNHYQQYLEQFG